MIRKAPYKVEDFDRYFSRGRDKVCYISERFPGKILKLSPLNKATQMIREMQYFEYLIRENNIPSFMPKFYGECSDEKHIGFVQELLIGEKIKPLNDIVRINYNENLSKVEDVILAFKQEMIDRNVIILDLHGVNIMGNVDTLKLWVIDGYGTPEFIPLPKYSRFFGKMKIERQWKKFVFRYTKILTTLSKERGEWIPSKIALGPYVE